MDGSLKISVSYVVSTVEIQKLLMLLSPGTVKVMFQELNIDVI